MRHSVRPLRDKPGNALFVTSEPSGKMQFDTIYGSDNIIMNKKVPFKYQVVKPYTSLVLPTHYPEPTEIPLPDGELLTVIPPSTGEIISAFQESLWVDKLLPIFEEADVHANNGATENALRYGEVLGYVTLLEGGDTIKMIKNVFLKLFKAILDVYKQAKKLNLVATMEVLSDLWLEYRYGWRPLMGDLENLHELMTHVRKDGVKSAYGTSQVRELPTDPIEIGTVDVLGKLGITFTYKVSLKPSKAFSKVGYNFLNTDSSRNDDWLALLGLDLESLPQTIWDMVPFSFVVDMFLNVGSILQVQNSSEQVSSFNHYRTHITEGDVFLECVAISLEVPGKPINWPMYFANFPKIKLRKSMVHPTKPVDPADLFIKNLQRGPYSTDSKNYWPRAEIFNGFQVDGRFVERFYRGKPDSPSYSPLKFDDVKVIFSKSGASVPNAYTIYVDKSLWTIDQPRAFQELLRYLDFGDMTDSECAEFIKGLLFPGSLRQRNSLKNFLASPPPYLGVSPWSMFTKMDIYLWQAFLAWPVPFLHGSSTGTQWKHYVEPLMLGYQPERRITIDANLSALSYELPIKVFTRERTDGVYHLFTADLDLSSGQFADLGALAISLTKRFRK